MHLVFVINHVAFFVSHRLPIAIEARNRGWRVTLLTGTAGSESMERIALRELEAQGITHQRFGFGSAGMNPFVELVAVLRLAWAMRRLRPDLVHCASPKGVIYGGIAARLANVPGLVQAVSGLGYVFTSGEGGAVRRVLAALVSWLARIAFGHPNLKAIVQNRDDQSWLRSLDLAPEEDVLLIRGSGVDLDAFVIDPGVRKQKLVVLPARLLRDKGVLEFVEAVRLIRKRVPEWRFVLAGAADYHNPSSVSEAQVTRWVEEGLVEWQGHVEDMKSLFAATSIVVLPSYREGLPKALLEASACGCAVITTNTTGCRDAVQNGVTGDLVPVRDVPLLAEAMLALINDPQRIDRYGKAGRVFVEESFALRSVLGAVFGAYEALTARSRSR